MKIAKFGLAVIGFFMMFGQAAQAQVREDVSQIVGVWEDRLPDGSYMMTTISPAAVSFLMVSRDGFSSGPPTIIEYSFSKYETDTYMATPIGPVGEPVAFKYNSKDQIFIQFEGRDPRLLSRQKPMASGMPANPHAK